jgi:hypothetical protein
MATGLATEKAEAFVGVRGNTSSTVFEKCGQSVGALEDMRRWKRARPPQLLVAAAFSLTRELGFEPRLTDPELAGNFVHQSPNPSLFTAKILIFIGFASRSY